MTININKIKAEINETGSSVILCDHRAMMGWGNCNGITPTIEITRINNHPWGSYLSGEKLPKKYRYLIEVYNTTTDDRKYYHHGEYRYLIGPEGPVRVDFDEDERCLTFDQVHVDPEVWYYNNVLTPYSWSDDEQKALIRILKSDL